MKLIYIGTNVYETKLRKAQHIIIYGAGYVGKSCYLRLRRKFKIECFAVTDKNNNDNDFLGIPVKAIDELTEYIHNSVIIIGVSDKYQDEVIKKLEDFGFADFLYLYFEPLNYEYYSNNNFELKAELENWYNLNTGKSIDLDHPKTFNEKIQWLKLYDNLPIKKDLADKYTVRNYVKDKIGEQYLIPLLGVWDFFEEIDFSKLPVKFVLKCNHASGTNLLINDKNKLNYTEVKEKFEQWMKINYAYCNGFEMHYANIKHKIIAEQMLESDDGGDLKDYKLFVFNGKVKLIQVDIDRHHNHRRNLYSPEWKYIPYSILYPTAPEVIISPPKCLEKLISLAEILGKDFIHVRVDFYICKDKIFFGEMTFAHGSGTENFEPESFGIEMGSWMKLPMEG